MAEGARRVHFDEAVNVLRIENNVSVRDSVASGASSRISITLQETSRITSPSNIRPLAAVDEERFNPALKVEIAGARLEAARERRELARLVREQVAIVERAQEEKARREHFQTGLSIGVCF